MTRFRRMIIWCLLLAGSPTALEAASLKVAPGRFMIRDVEPGRCYDVYEETGVRLTIYNDDETTRTWLLAAHRPSERGRWETGYAEIPDPSWCWFAKPEVTVAPKARAYAHLHLKIPGEEKYYNQHWVETLSVTGRPGQGGIALAVDIRVQIETRDKPEVTVRPHGALAVVPGTIVFKDPVAGESQRARLVLYNNEGRAHKYTLSPLFENEAIEPRVYLTHFHKRIPDRRWIQYPETVKVEGETSSVLELRLEVPGEADLPVGQWEDLLLIQPDERQAGFVRVQVHNPYKSKAGRPDPGEHE